MTGGHRLPRLASRGTPSAATRASLITHAPSFPSRIDSPRDLGRKSTAKIGHTGQVLALFAP